MSATAAVMSVYIFSVIFLPSVPFLFCFLLSSYMYIRTHTYRYYILLGYIIKPCFIDRDVPATLYSYNIYIYTLVILNSFSTSARVFFF